MPGGQTSPRRRVAGAVLGVAVGLLLALAATRPVGPVPVHAAIPSTSPPLPPAPEAWTGDPSLDAGLPPPAAPAGAAVPSPESVPPTTRATDPPTTDPSPEAPADSLPPPIVDPTPGPADPPAATPVVAGG